VQKCIDCTDKKLPTDSTSETFDTLCIVLSVVDEKFNENKKVKHVQVDGEGSEEEKMERKKVLTRRKMARLRLSSKEIVDSFEHIVCI
jgi:hypothetical protein